MSKRVKVVLTVVFVALVGVNVWWVAALPKLEPEPVYQGRMLTSWLDEPPSPQVYQALRQIGTNATPTLLRLLRAKDSKLMRLAQRQHFIRCMSAEERHAMGQFGFQVLGTNAQSAVPALLQIANENISRSSRLSVVATLGDIGPSAKEAAPSLLRWVTNGDVGLEVWARASLLKVDREAAAEAGITNSTVTVANPPNR